MSGESVFDGLERADVPTELHSRLGVIDGQVEQVLGSADLFDGQEGGSDPQCAGDRLGCLVRPGKPGDASASWK